MKADQDHPSGGKNVPVVLQIEEGGGGSSEEVTAGDSTETLVPYLQQINVRIEQQTEVLCVMIGIGCGLLLGIIFSVWFSKLWK